MTTTAEAYFLVRVGSWSEDDLEEWIQGRMRANDDDTYAVGHSDGYREGIEEGMAQMYKEAVDTIKGLR